jgi:hypothetical protein
MTRSSRSNRQAELAVRLHLFCPLRPLSRDLAFALTRIALVVLTFALCLVVLPLSGVLYALTTALTTALTLAVYALSLMNSPSFVLEVPVGTDGSPQLANVAARLPQPLP